MPIERMLSRRMAKKATQKAQARDDDDEEKQINPPKLEDAIPGRVDIEANVAAEMEQENTARLPQDAQELINTTLGPNGTLEKLQRHPLISQSLHKFDEKLFTIIKLLEDKTTQYFTEDSKPSAFAEDVLQAATTDKIQDPALMARHRDFVADLHLLLNQLKNRLTEILPADHAFLDDDKLIQAISSSRIPMPEAKEQVVDTIFGVVNKLADKHPDLVSLDLKKHDLPIHVETVHPLDPDHAADLYTRLRKQERYTGEVSVPEYIARSSEAAATELEEQAQVLDGDREMEKVRNAYLLLADWIREQAAPFSGAQMSTRELSYQTGRIHFAKEEMTTFAGLLNAAETVKQHNKELYLRLLGVGRSDLSANAFLFNVCNLQRTMASEHSAIGPDADSLRARVQALTSLHLSYPEVLDLHFTKDNIDDVETHMQEVMKIFAESPAAGAALMLPLARITEATTIYKACEAARFDEREQTLELLHTATPSEFIHTIENLPSYILEDPDVLSLVEQKFSLKDSNNERGLLRLAGKSQPPIEVTDIINGILEGRAIEHEDPSLMVRSVLWETASTETLLSQNFFDDLRLYEQAIIRLTAEYKEKVEAGEMKRKFNKEYLFKLNTVIEPLFTALAAHPDITKEQWHQCFTERLKHEQDLAEQDLGLFQQLQAVVGLSEPDKPVREVIETILGVATPERILATPTSFFCLHDNEFADPENYADTDPLKHFRRHNIPPNESPQDPKSYFYPGKKRVERHEAEKKSYATNHAEDLKVRGALPVSVWLAYDESTSLERKKNKQALLDFDNCQVVHLRTAGSIDKAAEMIGTIRWMRQSENGITGFLARLSEAEQKQILSYFFDPNTSGYQRLTGPFRPDSPWQLEVLQAAQELMPNDGNYQEIIKVVGDKTTRKKQAEQAGKYHISDEQKTSHFSQSSRLAYAVFVLENNQWQVKQYDDETNSWKKFTDWSQAEIQEPIQVPRLKNVIAIDENTIIGYSPQKSKLLLFDIFTGEIQNKAELPKEHPITCWSADNNGKVCVAYEKTKVIHFWDLKIGRLEDEFPLPGVENPKKINFTSDGKILIFGLAYKTKDSANTTLRYPKSVAVVDKYDPSTKRATTIWQEDAQHVTDHDSEASVVYDPHRKIINISDSSSGKVYSYGTNGDKYTSRYSFTPDNVLNDQGMLHADDHNQYYVTTKPNSKTSRISRSGYSSGDTIRVKHYDVAGREITAAIVNDDNKELIVAAHVRQDQQIIEIWDVDSSYLKATIHYVGKDIIHIKYLPGQGLRIIDKSGKIRNITI